ncbi:MAG: hypothetical protein WCB85_12160 [Candidatus Dormiibacterota bacterium]
MPWVVRRRWWILAGGSPLLLLGFVPSGPDTAVRALLEALEVVGLAMVFWAMLGVLLAIPMALRARRAARRLHREN